MTIELTDKELFQTLGFLDELYDLKEKAPAFCRTHEDDQIVLHDLVHKFEELNDSRMDK